MFGVEKRQLDNNLLIVIEKRNGRLNENREN